MSRRFRSIVIASEAKQSIVRLGLAGVDCGLAGTERGLGGAREDDDEGSMVETLFSQLARGSCAASNMPN